MTRRDFDELAAIVATDETIYKVRAHLAHAFTHRFPRFNSRLFFERLEKLRAEARKAPQSPAEGGDSERRANIA